MLIARDFSTCWFKFSTNVLGLSFSLLVCLATVFYYYKRFLIYAGIIEPIKSGLRDPKLGIGKQEEDDYFTAEENIQRKKLDIEMEETEEVARKREVC